MEERVVIVEDDPSLLRFVSAELAQEGYRVMGFRSISELGPFLGSATILNCLYILDVNLPDGSGFALCARLRRGDGAAPILMLTVLDDEDSIVKGLDSGADDYVVKPFSMKVLKSRLNALWRRKKGNVHQALQSGGLYIDLPGKTVSRGGEPLSLLPKELMIMEQLLSAGGTLVSRKALLDQIWDIDGDFIDDNTLSVHVSRLRKKLGAFDGKSYIVTERGFGYRWGVKIEKG